MRTPEDVARESGRHDLALTHTRPRYPGAAACGGSVYAEFFPASDVGSEEEEGGVRDSWECYCERCLECDPGGYDTLADAREAAPGFWQAGEVAGE